MYVIEVNLTVSSSCVLDVDCNSHICNNVYALTDSIMLTAVGSCLRVRNGARVVSLAVGTFVLEHENCFYVPSSM